MKILVIAMVLPGLLFADFRYEQTTRITKGMAMNVPFVKKPEPVTTTHYYKGGRMATVTGMSRTIIDFDKQLFTTINVKDRQYTQMTFEEMQQRMAELQSEMKEVGKGKGADMQIQFDAKATGVEKEVGGYPAKEVIFTIEMGASDGKNSGTMMIMKNDSWHSEAVTGYKEYRAFFERMKDKGSWLNMGQMQPQVGGQKGMVEGMKKLMGESLNSWIGSDGKELIQVFAKNWESAEKLLDQYFKGADAVGADKAFVAARKALPQEATFLMEIDAVQYTAVILDFIRPIVEATAPPLAANIPKPVKGDPGYVGIAVTLEADRGGFDLFVSSDAVKQIYQGYISPLLSPAGN